MANKEKRKKEKKKRREIMSSAFDGTKLHEP
jgi:hypothetical protein